MIVSLRDYPTLAAILRAQGYRKRNVILSIVVSGEHETGPAWWDGGSRTEYYTLSDSWSVSLAPQVSNPFAFNRTVGYPKVDVNDGVALLIMGTFCGKTATASVTCTEAFAEKMRETV